ncbi:hypothetical protein V4W67_21665 [Pseudomonas aeruginosa]
MVFGEPGFRETLFVWQVPSLFNSDAVLMVICVYQVACEFEVCAPDVVFDAVSQPARVEERLALAVGDGRPRLAVRVNAPLKAGFDSGNPADADLVQAFLDVRVRGAEVPDFGHQFLQG